MEQYQAPEVKKHGGFRMTAAAFGLAAVLFGGGYYLGSSQGSGKETNRLEELAKLPIAEGFLDVPNTYRIDIRENSAHQREVYVQNLKTVTEVPLTAKSPKALASYQENGTYLIDGAIWLNEAGRWLYKKAGGTPAGEKPITFQPE